MFGINGLRRLLRFTYGFALILVGLDKFFVFLTDWTQYLSPVITETIGVNAAAFMGLIGVVEIAIGIMLFTKWKRIAAYVISVYMILIALNIITTGQFFDIAARDLLIAVGAFVMANLFNLETSVPKAVSGDTPKPLEEKI